MSRGRLLKIAVAVGLTLPGQTTIATQENETVANRPTMKIHVASVIVEDQDRALEFYTKVLGFVRKQDIPVGEFRWLTVVSRDEPDGTELLLEPNGNPASKVFQKALFEQGIPLTAFEVDDVQLEYDRLSALGVRFHTKPTSTESATIAVFDDDAGDVDLHRPPAEPPADEGLARADRPDQPS